MQIRDPFLRKVLISIILPAFNSAQTIREAIDSILNQTYSNFELIIVDDASIDNTVEVVRSYSDKRIKLVRIKKNSGVTNALNRGIALAKGKYVARMDADDVMFPQRLEKQLAFMQAHDYDLISGRAVKINWEGKEIGLMGEQMNNNQIKVSLFFGCCIIHPTIFGKMSVFKKNKYAPEFRRAGDYELWSRLRNKTSFFIVPDILIKYRVGKNEAEKRKNAVARQFFNEIDSRNKTELKKLGLSGIMRLYGFDGVVKYLKIVSVKFVKDHVGVFS